MYQTKVVYFKVFIISIQIFDNKSVKSFKYLKKNISNILELLLVKHKCST